MKTTLNTVRVGLFFLVGVALIWIAYEMLSEGRLFREDGYEIAARFDDVQMLRSGDDVRMAGVRIGRVGDTRLDNGRAEVIFEIQHDVRIPRDSVASIAMSSMLGANYVGIRPGDPEEGFLQPTDEIATRHTADFNELFERLAEAGDQMENVFGDVSQAVAVLTGDEEEPGVLKQLDVILAENRDAIRTTLNNVEEITDKINTGDGTLARLINEDEAYESLQAAVEEIQTAAGNASAMVKNADEILAHVRQGEGTLGTLIYQDDLGRDIERIAANLAEVSDKLAAGEGTLGRLLADDSLYHDVEAVVQKAERTIDGLGEQGPITAVGIAANALF